MLGSPLALMKQWDPGQLVLAASTCGSPTPLVEEQSTAPRRNHQSSTS